MSDTPITDAALDAVINGDCLPTCKDGSHAELCPYVYEANALAEHMKLLEIGFTAAKETIKLKDAIIAKFDFEVVPELMAAKEIIAAQQARIAEMHKALEYYAERYSGNYVNASDDAFTALTAMKQDDFSALNAAKKEAQREIISAQDIVDINSALTELRNIVNIAQIRQDRKEPAYKALEKARTHLVRIGSMIAELDKQP